MSNNYRIKMISNFQGLTLNRDSKEGWPDCIDQAFDALSSNSVGKLKVIEIKCEDKEVLGDRRESRVFS